METVKYDLTKRNEVLVFHDLSEEPTFGGGQTMWLLSRMDRCKCNRWKYDWDKLCIICKEGV